MINSIRPTTLEAIVEAAFARLNADPTATLAEIAQSAGVGRATLHRHFKGRADLVQALAERALAETEQAAERASAAATSYTQALRRIMRAMIELGDRHWFLAQETTARSDRLAEEHARQRDEFLYLIQSAAKEGAFDREMPPAWVEQVYDHLIHAAWEMVRGKEATVNQAAELAWTTFVGGLRQTNR